MPNFPNYQNFPICFVFPCFNLFNFLENPFAPAPASSAKFPRTDPSNLVPDVGQSGSWEGEEPPDGKKGTHLAHQGTQASGTY